MVCNPTSDEKLARLVGLLRLPPEARVVDIACGKGEFLIRLAEAYGIRGIGIDISPFYIAQAQKQLQMRAQGVEVVFSQVNGADFRPEAPRLFAEHKTNAPAAGCCEAQLHLEYRVEGVTWEQVNGKPGY